MAGQILVILAVTIAIFATVILGAFLYAAVKGLTFREAWQAWREAVDRENEKHPAWITRWRRYLSRGHK